jgi:hypothetical protein
VLSLEEGGQADMLGLRVGYTCESVNGQPYSLSLLASMQGGSAPYEATFSTQGVPASQSTPAPATPAPTTTSASSAPTSASEDWYLPAPTPAPEGWDPTAEAQPSASTTTAPEEEVASWPPPSPPAENDDEENLTS